MRRILVLLGLLGASLALVAADPKPGSITPTEAADGWILLFDGDSTFGWTVDGTGKVDDGKLVLGGDKETTITTTTEFGDSELVLRYRQPLEDKKSLARVVVNGVKLTLVAAKEGVTDTITTQGGTQARSVAVGDMKPLPVPEGPREVAGRSTISLIVPAGRTLTVTDVRLRPLAAKSLFNGKDTKGWKEAPERKSKFTVTPEGWLNVKDGPGDLQTEGAWADFILQLDCISNGKHLNSGIFFRCRPGEYQQGYEAQIRNQFNEKADQKYTLEDYDPKTNELTGKREVMMNAVDYGTGAIYRRQPARKQMAKDGEWFTMTIAASGRHLATWVNGVQVADWTDNRPLKDNGRNGCRLEAGPISIQGHDPTTDLSFRNIRITELPKAK